MALASFGSVLPPFHDGRGKLGLGDRAFGKFIESFKFSTANAFFAVLA